MRGESHGRPLKMMLHSPAPKKAGSNGFGQVVLMLSGIDLSLLIHFPGLFKNALQRALFRIPAGGAAHLGELIGGLYQGFDGSGQSGSVMGRNHHARFFGDQVLP